MPSSNDAIANAIALDPEGDSHSSDTTGNNVSGTYPAFESWADDWYTITPAADIAVAIEIDATAAGSAFTPEVDIYESSLAPSPPTDWTTVVDLGWYVYDSGNGPTARAVVLMQSGVTYYLNAYLYTDVYDPVLANNVGPYTITAEPANTPPNDNIVDATVVPQGLAVTVSGTTVDATVEPEEAVDFDNGTPTTWHKVVLEGPGVLSMSIVGTGGFEPQAIVYYAAGGVTDYDDLTPETWTDDSFTEFDGTVYYNDSGSNWPLQGGEVFYIQIIGSNDNGPGDTGGYSLTISSPSPTFCLDAEDYINPSSTTATVVSGAVRETQRYQGYRKDVGTPPSVGAESFLLDEDATLVIPGADILDGASMGFYAVSVKTKNNNEGDFSWGGMRRNGQNMWPGSFIDSTAGTTPVTGWLTMPAGTDPTAEDWTNENPSGYHDSQGMVWYLPVHEDDEIEIILTQSFENREPLPDDAQVDITQICFQRMVDAQLGEPYDIIDMPDYPLGTTAADMNSINQYGDIIIYKDTNQGVNPSPQLTSFTLEGIDICVTNDGTLWCAATWRGGTASSGSRFQGPYLLKWNGTSWDIVNDDIEGLGVKRTARHIGVSNPGGPYFLSMDTDGEDIWIGYGVDDGLGPGGFRNTVGKVRKYDVSANSWSTVGGKIHGGVQPRIRTRNEVATFEDNMQVKVSPAGVVWVAFTDWLDGPDHDDDEYNATIDLRPAFTGRFNGSSWEIRTLPPPEWYDPFYVGIGSTRDNQDLIDDYFDTHQAEDVETGSPTVGTSSFLGATTITETQTTHANATFSFTPPAGKWSVVARVAIATGTGLMGLQVSKNGTPQYYGGGATYDHVQHTISATQFVWHQTPPFWFETDGSDTVELSYRLSAAGTMHFDKVYLAPAWHMISRVTWGGWYTAFVEDGQFHALLEFPDGEEPVAIYNTASTKPEFGDPDEWGYLPENTHYNSAPDTPSPDGPTYPDIAGGVFLVFPWIYSRWDSANDEWDRLWHISLIEREIPDSVIYKTLYHPWGFAAPVGHWQQGMSMCKDQDGNVYVAANLGIIQNSNDTYWAAKLTDTGMEMPWTRSPGITGGPGYSTHYSGFVGYLPWGWDNHAHSMVFANGQLYIGYVIAGVPDNYEDAVVTFAPNGIGDWNMASERNLPIGYNDLEPLVPVLAASPDGTKIYVASMGFIYDGPDATFGGDATAGVWECDVIEDAKIPLIPILRGGIDLSRIRMRAFFLGDS